MKFSHCRNHSSTVCSVSGIPTRSARLDPPRRFISALFPCFGDSRFASSPRIRRPPSAMTDAAESRTRAVYTDGRADYNPPRRRYIIIRRVIVNYCAIVNGAVINAALKSRGALSHLTRSPRSIRTFLSHLKQRPAAIGREGDPAGIRTRPHRGNGKERCRFSCHREAFSPSLPRCRYARSRGVYKVVFAFLSRPGKRESEVTTFLSSRGKKKNLETSPNAYIFRSNR